MHKRELKANFVNQGILRQALDRESLEVLVATSPENVFYLSGFYIGTYLWIRDRLNLVVVPRNDPETFIVATVNEPFAKKTGWIEDVRAYVEFAESPIDALAEVVTEKGLSKSRIGIEAKWWTVAYYQELLHRLPEATFVPADSILSRVRSIKTPAEIERLHKAALLTEEAVYAAWKRSHPGDTEKDVAERMIEEFTKNGADRVNHIMLASGQNTVIINHSPGAKKIERGEIVHSDHGAFYKGYWSDLARMGVATRPSPHQRSTYRTLWEVHRATIARMRPGTEAREIFNFAKTEYTKRGIDFSWAKLLGHSMGQAPSHDEPMLHPFNETRFEPNMLIASEPGFMVGNEYYHIEDLVLITDDEPQILSDQWNTEELFVFE
jgi:Xaa-Pro aminopeptidase